MRITRNKQRIIGSGYYADIYRRVAVGITERQPRAFDRTANRASDVDFAEATLEQVISFLRQNVADAVRRGFETVVIVDERGGRARLSRRVRRAPEYARCGRIPPHARRRLPALSVSTDEPDLTDEDTRKAVAEALAWLSGLKGGAS